MNIYLSHTSALKFWLTSDVVSNNREIAASRRKTHLASGTVPELSSEDAVALEKIYGLRPPFHVSVTDPRDRRYANCIQAHVVKDLPMEGLYVSLAEGVYVASPELALLQSASALKKQETIRAGFELCSTYRVHQQSGFTSYDEKPLTTASSIENTLRRCSRLRGSKKLAAAFAYIRDNSASPQETSHALVLGLPRSLGGKALGVPLMNCKIPLDERAARLVHKNFLKCDMYWPKHRFDGEYESYEFHSGKEALAEDSIRREALALMGITVMTITIEQSQNPSKLNDLADALSKGMGIRKRREEDCVQEERLLRKTLAADWSTIM